MNLLIEHGLPTELDGIPIFADFHNMIHFEEILQDETFSQGEKGHYGVMQLFGQIPPSGMERALELLMWFYYRGEKNEDAAQDGKPMRRARAYDFTKDAGHIYAAFLQAYGISLTTVPFLHWWEFMTPLEELPDSTLMARIMQWRTVDLSQIKDKGTRAHYAELKKQFALTSAAVRERSVEEISRRNQERVAKRFAEAEKRKKGADAPGPGGTPL